MHSGFRLSLRRSDFCSVTKYVNTDLHPNVQADTAEEKSYRLAGLYDRYFEYADLLATQGLIDEAVKLLDLIPTHYKGSIGAKFDYETTRDRLLREKQHHLQSRRKLHMRQRQLALLQLSPMDIPHMELHNNRLKSQVHNVSRQQHPCTSIIIRVQRSRPVK